MGEKGRGGEGNIHIYICIYCDFLVTSMSHFYDVLVHLFFSFLYDTLFPGNSVTNVRPFRDEIAFDEGVRGRSSVEEA